MQGLISFLMQGYTLIFIATLLILGLILWFMWRKTDETSDALTRKVNQLDRQVKHGSLLDDPDDLETNQSHQQHESQEHGSQESHESQVVAKTLRDAEESICDESFAELEDLKDLKPALVREPLILDEDSFLNESLEWDTDADDSCPEALGAVCPPKAVCPLKKKPVIKVKKHT